MIVTVIRWNSTDLVRLITDLHVIYVTGCSLLTSIPHSSLFDRFPFTTRSLFSFFTFYPALPHSGDPCLRWTTLPTFDPHTTARFRTLLHHFGCCCWLLIPIQATDADLCSTDHDFRTYGDYRFMIARSVTAHSFD